MKLLILFVTTFFASVAFAEDVAAPAYLDGVLAFLAGHPIASLSVILTIVAELGLKVYPSEKALSILIPVKYGLDGLKAILSWVGGIIDSFVQSAQNIKK